jgi:hypothetical protein
MNRASVWQVSSCLVIGSSLNRRVLTCSFQVRSSVAYGGSLALSSVQVAVSILVGWMWWCERAETWLGGARPCRQPAKSRPSSRIRPPSIYRPSVRPAVRRCAPRKLRRRCRQPGPHIRSRTPSRVRATFSCATRPHRPLRPLSNGQLACQVGRSNVRWAQLALLSNTSEAVENGLRAGSRVDEHRPRR